MTEEMVFQAMYASGAIPVVTVSNPQKAVGLAKAILAGGLRVLEIALRVDGAAACIQAVRQSCPEMVIGAGTILNRQQAEQARKAGAMFGVAPGYDEDVVAYCKALDWPFIPGTISSTDIQKGVKAGLKVIKFFPSEPHGGLKTIGYLAAPFTMVKFLPAGGIGFHNLVHWKLNPTLTYRLFPDGTFLSEGR